MNSVMEEKCDVYKAKGILGFGKWKTYTVAAKKRANIETIDEAKPQLEETPLTGSVKKER